MLVAVAGRRNNKNNTATNNNNKKTGMQSHNPRRRRKKNQEKKQRERTTSRCVRLVMGPGVISRLSVSQHQQHTTTVVCVAENAPSSLPGISALAATRPLVIIFFSFSSFSETKNLSAHGFRPFFPVVRCLLTINGHNRNRKLASRLKCLRWCGWCLPR